MPKMLSNFGFRFMSWSFKIFKKKEKIMKILEEANLKSGDVVLDYGCGPGNFSIPAAQIVSDSGKVFAADRHPLSAKFVHKTAKKAGVLNYETILTTCNTGLEDSSVNVVLLYDVFHYFKDIKPIFTELYRVLKTNGNLSVEIHHMDENEALNSIIETKLFKLLEKKEHTFLLQKILQ